MAAFTWGRRAAGLGCLIRAEPFRQRQEANYLIFFLGIRGSSLEGGGEKTELPWRLLGWAGSWEAERVVVVLGLETCWEDSMGTFAVSVLQCMMLDGDSTLRV